MLIFVFFWFSFTSNRDTLGYTTMVSSSSSSSSLYDQLRAVVHDHHLSQQEQEQSQQQQHSQEQSGTSNTTATIQRRNTNNNDPTTTSSSKTTTTSGGGGVVYEDERVEVNQRALIDKILARYASEGAVYRELLQNSNDAQATMAEVCFRVTNHYDENNNNHNSNHHKEPTVVLSVEYRNNGAPFSSKDWARLKKIAEGNPDESKIGAFGVGAYTMFSIANEPLVISNQKALAFVWKGDSLWTKTVDYPHNNHKHNNNNNSQHNNADRQDWTTFVLPSRDPYPLPDLVEFGRFLCASLTFTQNLKLVRVFVNDQERLSIIKTEIQESKPVLNAAQYDKKKKDNWWGSLHSSSSSSSAVKSPNGLFTLQDFQESGHHFGVMLDGVHASIRTKYRLATVKTHIPSSLSQRMIRVTKKPPPKKLSVQIFWNASSDNDNVDTNHNNHNKNKAQRILESLLPTNANGKIFIGFPTSQTTGMAAHIAAPFVPTVEREAMDLQDPTLRVFNLELLHFSGLLLRWTLESSMESIGRIYQANAQKRRNDQLLLLQQEQQQQEEEEDQQQESQTQDNAIQNSLVNSSNEDGQQEVVLVPGVSSTDSNDNENDDARTRDTTKAPSAVWGFAKFMAKGVQQTLVKVVKNAQDLVGEDAFLHPKDTAPLYPEEREAIRLMQSFCPKPSTPDPTVGIALAEGFASSNKAAPTLTQSGMLPSDMARLPNKGIEAFCKDNVVRSLVYDNTKEYHDLICKCPKLGLQDLRNYLRENSFQKSQLILFLKWWFRYSKSMRYSSTSNSNGVDLKEQICFTLGEEKEERVHQLGEYLFYLDTRIIPISTHCYDRFSNLLLPMPETLLPQVVQDPVSTRILADSIYHDWFVPLPIEIWLEYISHHDCMTQGNPEDDVLRLLVLSVLNQEYNRRRKTSNHVHFGDLCRTALQYCRCIPLDNTTDPSITYTADIPSNLYLTSVNLQEFGQSSTGAFRKVSSVVTAQPYALTETFLIALGVRQSVSIDFVFAELDRMEWSSNPKPLVEHLRLSKLTEQDLEKLKRTRYLPAHVASNQNKDSTRKKQLYAPSELYLSNDVDLRNGMFPFVRLLQWPQDDIEELTPNSLNGKFLISTLGMNSLPPLLEVLKYIANDLAGKEHGEERVKCLEFVCKYLSLRNHPYRVQYERIGRKERTELKFLPGKVRTPLWFFRFAEDDEDKTNEKGVYSVLTCCTDQKCAVMGIPIIDPELGDRAKVFGNLFQCVTEPSPNALLKKLDQLVFSAKQALSKAKIRKKKNELELAKHVVSTFLEIFKYLSSRTPEMNQEMIADKVSDDFIPCLVQSETANEEVLQWFRPSEVFFKNTNNEAGDGVVETLFQTVDFCPFLSTAGVRQEVSTKDIFHRMIDNPQEVLAAVKTKEKYQVFLRRIAANKPFKQVTKEIRESPFLLAYSEGQTKFELAKAKDIFIIDNSFFARMFPVKGAPHESDLEEFYELIGSKYISKEVVKKYDIVGSAKRNTVLTKELMKRIAERRPLLVSPSITSKRRVPNAQSVLDEKHLEVYEAPNLKAVYSLKQSVRTQRITCFAQQGRFGKALLYVTPGFDWFDIAYAIGELILERCELEDAFLISSLLEKPLAQLKARGFPVDRIIQHDDSQKVEEPARRPETTEQNRAERPTPGAKLNNFKQDAASTETFVAMLKQVFPDADEKYIRERLGENPSPEKAQSLAEEMATFSNYPKRSSNSQVPSEDSNSQVPSVGSHSQAPSVGNASLANLLQTPGVAKAASKMLGSKRLSRALGGLKGGNFGGSLDANRLLGQGNASNGLMTDSPGGLVAAPPSEQTEISRKGPIAPGKELDIHNSLERTLEQAVQQSKTVNQATLQSPERQAQIPKGLDLGPSCEVIPGQNLKPFTISNPRGESFNGIKIFTTRKNPLSERFLRSNLEAIDCFSVVLERLCREVFEMQLSSVAIYHDPTGRAIAFNYKKALYFNLHFFHALHYSPELPGKLRNRDDCFSYWFVTFAHELAHHLVSAHNREHGFYTERHVSLYLPKLASLQFES